MEFNLFKRLKNLLFIIWHLNTFQVFCGLPFTYHHLSQAKILLFIKEEVNWCNRNLSKCILNSSFSTCVILGKITWILCFTFLMYTKKRVIFILVVLQFKLRWAILKFSLDWKIQWKCKINTMWWSHYVVIVIFIYQCEAMYWGLNTTWFSSQVKKKLWSFCSVAGQFEEWERFRRDIWILVNMVSSEENLIAHYICWPVIQQ